MLISDFARLGQVSVRMLRHYDAIGLLEPDRVDPSSGYRSYSPEQLHDLNRIVALKDLGFTLEQVRALRSRSGPRSCAECCGCAVRSCWRRPAPSRRA